MKRFRIIADGTTRGTKITDADTGASISNVTRVAFHHDASHAPRILIEVACMDGAELELVAEGEIVRKVLNGNEAEARASAAAPPQEPDRG